MDYSNEILKAIQERHEALDVLVQRVNYLESKDAKASRPNFGVVGHDDFSIDAKEHQSAFKKYICKGETHGLGDLQMKAMATNQGDTGGYAVPKVIDGMIADLAVNISPIRAIAQTVQISTQDYHKLVNKRGTASGWVGETAARPETATATFADIAPPMGELYANLSASQVMLDDAFFNADQWMAEQAATEFARAEGLAFISGNGVNQPMGFLSNPVANTSDATRAFGTLEYVYTGTSGNFKTTSSSVNPSDDLFTLAQSLKAAYRKNAVFVMNKKTLFAVMGMKDNQGRYIFNPTTQPGMQDTLLGYPIFEAEDMPDYATANGMAIAFGNFQQGYIIADRIGTRVLRDPFSNKPNVMFYVTKRLGGSVLNSECIKLLKFGTS
ncbi:MAG: phage major capsid protein [Thiobacillaceae bacterium]